MEPSDERDDEKSRAEKCPRCDGTGLSADRRRHCPACLGTGKRGERQSGWQ
jgi:DnaJ-class molecular chaperone